MNLEALSENHTKNDCAIIEVPEFDMKVVEKGEDRQNAIQIIFSEISIIWDLNENKEVAHLSKPDEFSN